MNPQVESALISGTMYLFTGGMIALLPVTINNRALKKAETARKTKEASEEVAKKAKEEQDEAVALGIADGLRKLNVTTDLVHSAVNSNMTEATRQLEAANLLIAKQSADLATATERLSSIPDLLTKLMEPKKVEP
jgi:hypothetical protein